MKILERGSDLTLRLNITDDQGNKILSSFSDTTTTFTVKVFTTSKRNGLEYSKSSIQHTNKYITIYINSSELDKLDDGIIAYTYTLTQQASDGTFSDNTQSYTNTVYTDYYLKDSKDYNDYIREQSQIRKY